MCTQYKKQGFTLVELSIVIVIIGVLVAGIAGGASMIHQAQLRSIINDYRSYEAAYNNFKAAYNGVPGDIPDASSYWADGVCGTPATICDGNNNGSIDDSIQLGSNPSAEVLSAPKELSLAGMISAGIPVITAAEVNALAGYSGADPSTYGVVYTYFPISRVNNLNYILQSYDEDSNHALTTAVGNDNYMVLQSYQANSGMTPIDAFSIDEKIDDGSITSGQFYGALTGKVRTVGGATCITVDLANLSLTTYVISTTTPECIALFDLQ